MWHLYGASGVRRREVRSEQGEVRLMNTQKPYTPAVWEIILLQNEDIVTTSGWNNNGNGNGNGHWFDKKPGNGHKKP